jgi:hypothetical protein
VTVDVAEETFPKLSVARNVTVVVPIGKIDGALLETFTKPTRSLARAPSRKRATTGFVAGTPLGPVAVTVIESGGSSVGAAVSTTVTVNEAVPVLLRVSIALHVTVVAPSGKVFPEDKEPQVGVSVPSTRSTADAE